MQATLSLSRDESLRHLWAFKLILFLKTKLRCDEKYLPKTPLAINAVV